MLTLYEELFLLSIDDSQGKIASSASGTIRYGLAGAILADLVLQGKLQMEAERLTVLDQHPLGDENLDGALGAIAACEKPRKPGRWINTLGEKKLPKRVANGLAAKEILKIEDKRYQWVIPYAAYPQQNASAKYWVKHYLRAVVLGGEKAEPGVVVLLSLIKSCRLLNLVFTKDERKAASEKVDELIHGEFLDKAMVKTLEQIGQAAAHLTAG